MHAAHAAAVEVCTGCPVASDCLADALRFEAGRSRAYRHGVWGGVRAAERVRLDAARRTRPGVPVHGTPTGYRRGCRCLPCCDAKTVDQRQRREERRRKVDG
jgi:hypothetical protein